MSLQNLKVSEGVEVWLLKSACRDLLAAAEKPLLDEFGETEGVGYFSSSECYGTLDVSFMTAPEFSRFAILVLGAADQSEWLKPHKADLKAALEADPRFMAKAA